MVSRYRVLDPTTERGLLCGQILGALSRPLPSEARNFGKVEPDAPVGVFEYVGITQYLADLFPNKGTRDASFLSESRIVTEVSKDSLLWQRGAVLRHDALCRRLMIQGGQSRGLLVGANALPELRNRECRGLAVLQPMWHAA